MSYRLKISIITTINITIIINNNPPHRTHLKLKKGFLPCTPAHMALLHINLFYLFNIHRDSASAVPNNPQHGLRQMIVSILIMKKVTNKELY